jgi:hypothetical protein
VPPPLIQKAARSERARRDHEAESGSSLRLPTRRRWLGLVERRRQRSLHDCLRVWGMTLARQAGIDVKSDVPSAPRVISTRNWSKKKRITTQAWMLHALAVYHAMRKQAEVGKFQQTLSQSLEQPRQAERLHARVAWRLAAHNYGYRDQAKTLIAKPRKRREDRFTA